MAHSHAHSQGEAASEYFRDQLCTIAACGFLGAIGVLMYQTPMQKIILAPAFEAPVLVGGIALLAIVFIRAVSVWKVAGMVPPAEPPTNHDHSHAHSHSHGHEHSHADHAEGEKCDHPSHQDCGHDHGEEGGHEDHDHGSSPWQYIVLMIPIALYFLNLPNTGFSSEGIEKLFGQQEIAAVKLVNYPASSLLTSTLLYSQKSTVVRPIASMNELNLMTLSPGARAANEGNRVSLKGMYLQSSNHEFDLFKLKRVCCGADALPIRARIVSQQPIEKMTPRTWLNVTGELHFVKTPKGEWVSVIVVDKPEDIVPAEQDTEFEDM
jgi:hypothetical protein